MTTQRRDVTFLAGGVKCAGWFYEPEGGGRRPGVVLGHGFGGIKEARLDAYAERFAAAGLAVLVFDYRHFGASEGEPRQVLDVREQLEDWRAALAWARAQPQVHPACVAIWGTSFGGGHVLSIAAEDPQVAAVVSQVPFCDGRASRGDLRQALRLAVRGLRDLWHERTGRPPVDIAIVGEPGSMAALTTPDAMAGYLALAPQGVAWENRVAARIVLQVPFYRPGTRTGRIRCPILFCIADRDVLTPPGPILRAAALAPRATVLRYPCAHFEIYVGEMFERAVSDQVRFLKGHLGQGQRD